MEWYFKVFKPVAKKEKITENFENIFPKYSLKIIYRKFRLTKISGYTVYCNFILDSFSLMIWPRFVKFIKLSLCQSFPIYGSASV